MAVMFGGYQPKLKRVNDVYIIDFQSMVRWVCFVHTCRVYKVWCM